MLFVENAMSKICPSWTFISGDAKGRVDGLALGVHSRSIQVLNSRGDENLLGAEIFTDDIN